MGRTNKIVLLGMLTSVALVLHIVEGFIPLPSFMPPGAKLGLANIVTIIALLIFGFKETAMIVILRTFLGSLFGGGLTVFLYSIVGGMFSAVVMNTIYKRFDKYFSLVGISITGGIAHNIGQLMIFSIIVRTWGVFIYLPALLLTGLATGYFIGLTASFLERYVKRAANDFVYKR